MEMHDLCAIAAREKRCVLATAVKVEGHAYRKQGVSMLLTDEGVMYGSISPGCLESDLQVRVDHVLDTEELQLVEYDMRPEDDLSWGETIGCGGLIVILLEPVCGKLRSILSEMHSCFQSGSAVELTRSFQHRYTSIQYEMKLSDHAGGQASSRPSLVTKDGGASKVGRIEKAIETKVVEISKDPVEKSHLSLVIPAHFLESSNAVNDPRKNGLTRDREALAEPNGWGIPLQITSIYPPKPRLIIIGAGNDVIPVASLSRAAGFRVVVGDWRESLCTAMRFPGAELVLGFPREIMSVLEIKSGDYIVLMSHQFPREREFLELLGDRTYSYLGIMGSRTRTARLLNGLPPFEHVHSPVGLTIGADGPEEIAISIVAELIACRRTGAAKSCNPQRGIAHATDGHSARGR
ncbi:XdhC family protein [Paenibacillus sp. QZ-Y1]|uniref:XdhC family protein n=1 Tax=Paenibacillus sp. QZ-Y1 TaxID=3414511 RepID=UPI003F7ADCFE